MALPTPFRQIGPLAVPVPIPTLAPRSVRSWDISPGLIAHEHSEGNMNLSEPLARIEFTDPRQQRWIRDYSGDLEKYSEARSKPNTELTPENELQMGGLSRLNPLIVALAFIEALQKTPDPNVDSFPGTLDPFATSWRELTDEDWAEIAQETSAYALPAHVYYRTPRVAYVRLMSEEALDSLSEQHSGEYYPNTVITLVFRGELGWRVFSYGPTSPEWIAFKSGETLQPLRSYLDETTDDESS